MENIKIRDYAFAHAKYSTDYQSSKYINWDRGPLENHDRVVFYTDAALPLVFREREANRNKVKIAWLLEPADIHPDSYHFVAEYGNEFDLILSHNTDFVNRLNELGLKAQWVPFGGCWIKPEDQKVFQKTEMTSIIASGKRMTEGHRMRHSVIERASNRLTVRGRGYDPIEYKLDLLKDFRFHVVIENTKVRGWFTEKLIDCFSTGTIPIYWGDPSISSRFNEEGMICCQTENEVVEAINSVTPEFYDSVIHAINENFERSKEFLITEDYIYEKKLSTL